jgi:hypothetical protein
MAQDIKPKFEVHKLEGTFMRSVAKVNKKSGGFTYEDVETDKGWMVYLPNGSSVHILTEADLVRQGYGRPAKLVDMNTGDEVGEAAPSSLKAISEQKNNRSKGGISIPSE